MTLPAVDLSADVTVAARAVEAACRDSGFFYVTGHGLSDALLQRLQDAARTFFHMPVDERMEIAMAHGGRAWRGYFPVGAELTSGRPDLKEGLYFGTELDDDHPRVRAAAPLHGRNLFPRRPPELRAAVLDYLDALGGVATRVLRAVAVSLDLEPEYFAERYTANPTVLFRIFHYPPASSGAGGDWGVGEHTDYGLLTLLAQDENPGLQVATSRGWVDAPPLHGALVCNIGDMLDRLTGGWYRSTAHRVVNRGGHERLSLAYFFDPDFDAEIVPLPARASVDRRGRPRWDGADLQAFRGTYGDYLVAKVAKVFPALRDEVS